MEPTNPIEVQHQRIEMVRLPGPDPTAINGTRFVGQTDDGATIAVVLTAADWYSLGRPEQIVLRVG